ncbi:DUF2087 domain-containing protein [Isobaculum melis]|uniref:DUF2087 domain-containing protein n=1 Tax=Isobaculum melis TaxID=142588 RepID=A0A1H9UDA2_9LACT|nr:DUF2087 domain-containing protein [Isobaculum melis]SES07322.1 hypothetical protein SAMN04488559_12717 [Isobaculum melis]
MNGQVIQTFFKEGKLIQIPKKEGKKLIIFNEIIQQFDIHKQYSEKEVNEIIQAIYADFAIIRRYLVDYRYLNRDRAGTIYSVNKEQSQD